MLPSMRVMVRLAKNNPNIHSSMLEPTSTNRSIFVMPVRCNGVMEALHPSTKKMLNRLLPITFPIAISGFFFKAATMEVASSGRDVPPATRVSPMTDSLLPDCVQCRWRHLRRNYRRQSVPPAHLLYIVWIATWEVV